ncbi:MAG: hypothetical protein KKB51_22210 [Candidatus Riflebacteria bacterium]|nr:hypothetical protein [Candidatus Riflebacteria bacterium]
MRADKRTSNLFIAGGYCLVAIIILLNYLGQADIKDKTTVKPAYASVSHADDSGIARQLKEEKRVNLEMREMLTRLQGLMSDPKRSVSNQSPPAAVSASGRYEIPELNYELLNAIRPRSSPFIPGKNPFSAPTKIEGAPAVTGKGLEGALRCDPSLPFIVSGASSHSGYFSNY